MAYKRLQTISFFIIFLAVLVLVAILFRPFINMLALGLILAILFRPLYVKILNKIKSENAAAGLTVVIVLLIILIPAFFFGQVLFNEIVNLYNKVKDGGLVLDREQIVQSLPVQAQTAIENVSRDLNSILARVTSNAFQGFSSLVSNVASFFLSFFLLFFSLFYLIRDGSRIKQIFIDISPIANSQENALISRIVEAVNGVVKGSFLVALIQGIVATIGFFIFGVPEPIIWGLFTILAALVPTVGTSLSLIPAIAYLVITGHLPQAIGLTIWAVLAVGLIDNFVGPKLVGARVKVHPLLVLLSVLGGVQLFGFLGFLLGPILMAVFMAMIDMYRTDFKEYIQQ
jgi:predicted PurR-regulated permease PerM